MGRLSWAHTLLTISTLVSSIAAGCNEHTPAFPPPDYARTSPELLDAFNEITNSLTALLAANPQEYNTSSYSIEITSTESTLWSTYHTATVKDASRPGAAEVNGDSTYRIASITKTFTVLGLLYQHAAGNLSLDHSVDTYVSDLRGKQNGTLPWKDITLRSLASQLSGLPRDFAQGEIQSDVQDSLRYGFPPVAPSGAPDCGSYNNNTPCTEADLISWLRSAAPLFAPNQQSTYSNLAFELLGIVLANVTGLSYEDYVQTAILNTLGMTHSSFLKPSDSVAVLPAGESWYWDVDEGVQNPTGGLFATSSDMSAFLRYILAHFNGITPALNWFQPVSFAQGVNSFYGIPWEIFRTDDILANTNRPVTFVTKGGGLPGYSTNIILVPGYSLGITLLTGGNPKLLGEVREIVTTPLIRAADKLAQRQTLEKYSGTYASHRLNSTVTFSLSPHQGMYVSRLISNGTDSLSLLLESASQQGVEAVIQLIPTQLFRDEQQKRGEIFRAVLDLTRPPSGPAGKVWDPFCNTDVVGILYAGKPVGEMVFWDMDDQGDQYVRVELTAFRVWLDRVADREDESLVNPEPDLSVQEL